MENLKFLWKGANSGLEMRSWRHCFISFNCKAKSNKQGVCITTITVSILIIVTRILLTDKQMVIENRELRVVKAIPHLEAIFYFSLQLSM